MIRARVRARTHRPDDDDGWVGTVLRAPLFWKLFLAQFVLLLVAIVFIHAALPAADSEWALLGLVVGGPLVTVALSAWIVHVVLWPIHALTETARRVGEGDWSARAPSSALSDLRLEQLGHVFNDMLDTLADDRVNQRVLSQWVLAAEEREREQVAHELYAGTAQTLAGVLIRLRVLRRALTEGDPDPVLEEVVAEVRRALEEVRSVARRLRPPELDELGVRAALEAHARGLSEKSGVPITLDGDLPEQDLGPGARLALFRIVQEGLNNAVLHAQASRVEVRFSTLHDGFRADVEDDGIGFNPAAAEPTTDSRLGVVGMHERADYVRGHLEIRSARGRGTRVRLDLPWALTEPPTDPSHDLLHTALPDR
ncbi:MAG: sensor histidine kinase [Gemmatimonadetes bacterium]|nr:sensor histidine kinase [Gemmatimonadota bacterium]NNK64242.1 sensor histidine kinase [Gemmatimonadota bacterium]